MSEALNYGPPIISVDVEDWFQSSWDHSLAISPGASRNTEELLDLLSEVGVKATMFVLGKFGAAYPDTVRRIAREGHEIGCHGWGHIEIFHQSRVEFTDDVGRAKSILEDLTGRKVVGYRAPDFSVMRETLWALEVLSELGFEYDSSIYPVRGRRYGIPAWPSEPVRLRLGTGKTILELPIGTWRFLGRNFPVGGGGYHRLLPGSVARLLARRSMMRAPFVFYCHPYEINPEELWQTSHQLPLSLRLHQGLGRGRFQGRLRRFLRVFGGRPFEDVLTGHWPVRHIDEVLAPPSPLLRRVA